MRCLLTFLLMLPVLAWGQSSLPRCTAAETDLGARRHNCFGTVTAPDGEKYLGDWQDGTWHDQGTQYNADGNIALSGRWENGKLVQRFALVTNRFPFNSPVAHPGKAERDRLPTLARDQSSFPPCQGDDGVRWNNCFGPYISHKGYSYVGVWISKAHNLPHRRYEET